MRVAVPAILLLLLLLFISPPALAAETAVLPDAQILVSPANPLPSYLEPEPLVKVSEFARSAAGVRLREDAAEALKTMLAALKEAGVKDIYVNSGYRNFVRQGELYTAKVTSYRRQGYGEEQAAAAAARWVLPAGESEHQTGLAVDLSTSSIGYDLNHSFANTAAGRWLHEHCHEYGFIVRYSEEKEPLTGVAPEPWHFRYVGADHAAYMREQGLCLEEYHALIKESTPLLYANSAGENRAVYYATDSSGDFLPGLLLSSSVARKNSGEYILTLALPPEPLFDISGHWAELQIRRLYELTAVGGYPDGSFRPNGAVSRGEFVTMLSRLPIWEAVNRRAANAENPEKDTEQDTETATQATAAEKNYPPLPYLDIDETKYYYQPLEQCFRAVLVQHMLQLDANPQLFSPEQALLRREAALGLAAFLVDENFEPPQTPTYSDVSPAAAALFKAVELLSARGVVTGDLTLFNPEKQVSRAEICAMLSRLLDALAEDERAAAAALADAAAPDEASDEASDEDSDKDSDEASDKNEE